MHQVYGIIGYPLGHSFSPVFFNEKFTKEGIDAEYLKFEIPDIADFTAVIRDNPQLRGLNVTIPYKEKVIAYLDALDPAAAEIGAVNVIKVTAVPGSDKPRLVGYNSDVIGFVDSIRDMLTPLHRKALVLGTGGASKAVAVGLRSLGVEPVLVSRRQAEGCITYADLTPEVMAGHTVIVNTTPVGMYPNVDKCPDIPYNLVTPEHVCYDVIYNPDPTLFCERCARQGAKVRGGIDMLHLQAIAAWNIWQE